MTLVRIGLILLSINYLGLEYTGQGCIFLGIIIELLLKIFEIVERS